jgi:hypothetical protein
VRPTLLEPVLTSEDADQLAKAVVAVSKIDRLTESAEEPLPSGLAPLVRLVTNDPSIVIYWRLEAQGEE